MSSNYKKFCFYVHVVYCKTVFLKLTNHANLHTLCKSEKICTCLFEQILSSFYLFLYKFCTSCNIGCTCTESERKKNVYSKKYYNVNLIQHKNEDMLYLQTDFPSSVKTLKYGAPFFLKLILLFSISELEALQISKYLMKTFGKIQFNRK